MSRWRTNWRGTTARPDGSPQDRPRRGPLRNGRKRATTTLRAHFVDPVWMLTTYGRQQALEAPPAPPKSNTGVVVAGVAFVALVGFAAWVAGRK
jgi:hypothetical protein